MPDERTVLVEATGRLERALLAVKARETKLLSAIVQRSVDEFHRDWQAHFAEATAAHVDPFYLPGHEGLIDRLQELRADPAVEELPSVALDRIDAILDQNTRRSEAVSHVHEYLAGVEDSRARLDRLKDLADTFMLKLEEVHTYDTWHDNAERLLADGQAIIDDHGTYGPCLEHNPGVWTNVHAGVRDLAAALGRETTSLYHRQPELYLEPITRPLPDLRQARDADASYRRLRDQWHKHVALAEANKAHPYEVPDHVSLIDAMRELRDRPDLATNARQALDTLLHDYTHLHRDRQHIHAWLDETGHALKEYQRFKDTVQTLRPLDVSLEDITGYGEWKERALRLADAGEAILADEERYGIHLDDRADDAERIRASVAHFNTAIGREEASIRRQRSQSLSDNEEISQRRSQSHGIKL